MYKNFFKIFGFLGAPGSIPSKLLLKGFSLCLMPIGNTEKKTIHQTITYITIEPVISFRGIPEEEVSETFKFDLEDEITKTCKSFALNNFKQEKNLIDTIKQNCRKIIKEKTGKRPFTNVNIARI